VVIGPNCLGIMMMPGVALNASFSAHMPGPGNLALISQSGAIATGEDASALSSPLESRARWDAGAKQPSRLIAVS
jgi:succinyl-CoA synthetase alpha subunit